jgi:hypothetical protein
MSDFRDLRPVMIGVNSTLIVLSLAAISCRVWRKMTLGRGFGSHDGKSHQLYPTVVLELQADPEIALIIIATLCAIIFSVLQMATTRFRGGKSEASVRIHNEQPYLKVRLCQFLFNSGIPLLTMRQLDMASRLAYFICNWSVKHSLLFFYAELTIDRWPCRFIHAMHAIAFAFGCTCIGATIYECSPIRKSWDVNTIGSCINIDAFNYFNACFMLATDLILYAMPLIFTWNLHLLRTQRIAVNFLFALGVLVLAASGARVYFVHAQAKHPHFAYRDAATLICAVIENHLAIIVACAPSIKLVVLRAFPSLKEKFERLVSRVSQKDEGYRSSAIVTLEVGAGSMGTKEGNVDVVRPLTSRILTDESGKSTDSRMGKWWRAPSNWHVNTA